jgi:hypothetical protein
MHSNSIQCSSAGTQAQCISFHRAVVHMLHAACMHARRVIAVTWPQSAVQHKGVVQRLSLVSSNNVNATVAVVPRTQGCERGVAMRALQAHTHPVFQHFGAADGLGHCSPFSKDNDLVLPFCSKCFLRCCDVLSNLAVDSDTNL